MKQSTKTIRVVAYQIGDGKRTSRESGEVIVTPNSEVRLVFADGDTVPVISGDGSFTRFEAKSLEFHKSYVEGVFKRLVKGFGTNDEFVFGDILLFGENATLDILVTEYEKGDSYTASDGSVGAFQGTAIRHSIIGIKLSDEDDAIVNGGIAERKKDRAKAYGVK